MGGDWHTHLTAYDQAPPGDKYAIVLDGADHYFGGLICNFAVPGPPRTAALDIVVAKSLDFMQAYASHDPAARRALERAMVEHEGFSLVRK